MIQFSLPQELIAQKPAQPRDSARLLVYDRRTKLITHDIFRNILQYLPQNTTLVVNNSKVEQCRWLFHGGRTELMVLEKLDANTVRALVRPGRKFKVGKRIQLTDFCSAVVTAIDEAGIRTLRLSIPHDDTRLTAYEHVPMPPYIAQDDTLADEYQTVYARPLGSKAAPTAGLHFTEELLERIAQQHTIAELTLHVGLGTFAKLTEEQLKTGKLHDEYYEINQPTATLLNKASHRTAVGTTSVRTLESAINHDSSFTARTSSTDILIQPGYKFRAVDALVTNFHFPGTSLLLLVAAFIEHATQEGSAAAEADLLAVYEHAITQRYRFYSFGDAMLLL